MKQFRARRYMQITKLLILALTLSGLTSTASAKTFSLADVADEPSVVPEQPDEPDTSLPSDGDPIEDPPVTCRVQCEIDYDRFLVQCEQVEDSERAQCQADVETARANCYHMISVALRQCENNCRRFNQ